MNARPALVLAAAAALAACGSHARTPERAAAPRSGWAYEVIVDDDARELGVMATFPPGTAPTLSVDEQATRFVRDVEVADGGAWRAVRPSPTSVWTIDACARAGCSVRYRFLLAEAADALDDPNLATKYDGAIEAPPSSWLLRPTEFAPGIPYRFHVQTQGSVAFASGVTPARDAEATYEADVVDLELAPYSVFGHVATRTIDLPDAEHADARIEVARLPGRLAMDDAAIDAWVRSSARAVRAFYGRFPVARALVVVVPTNGDDVGGKTLASGGASILLDVGGGMKPKDIPDDWVLTHEMTHLAFPSLPFRYAWLEEGLATYVEPIARARAGILPVEEVWRGLVRGLPNGEPGPNDRGLDRTRTWGRTYWGGAMFCLVADLRIREATQNRRSLDDALRAILAQGGNGEVRWPIDRALAVGDAATGTKVLEELHAAWGAAPVRVDLAQLWSRLGVRVDRGAVTLDDAAPEASIRRAITGVEPPHGARAER